MKSVQTGEVKVALQMSAHGYSVTHGTWCRMIFGSYTEANDWFEKFV